MFKCPCMYAEAGFTATAHLSSDHRTPMLSNPFFTADGFVRLNTLTFSGTEAGSAAITLMGSAIIDELVVSSAIVSLGSMYTQEVYQINGLYMDNSIMSQHVSSHKTAELLVEDLRISPNASPHVVSYIRSNAKGDFTVMIRKMRISGKSCSLEPDTPIVP